MKNARIFEGNCLDVMREMEDCSVDLAITSPPYDNLRTYDGKSEWGDHVWKKAIMGLYRVLKEGGVCVWIVSDQSINGSETGSSFRQALHAMDCGFRLHDTMIWEKPGFTATGALRVRYAQVFEYMFIFSKGRPKTFNPIKDRKNKSAGGKQHGSNRLPDGTFKQKSSDGRITKEFGQRFNIWRHNMALGKKDRCGHPAPFPIELVKDHIISWSNPGDLVFDPFAGSGTTGIASIETKRNFIGAEINPEYCKIARARIEAHQEEEGE